MNTTPTPELNLLPANDKFLFGLLGIITLVCFAVGTHVGINDMRASRSLQIQSSPWGGMYLLGGLMWQFQYIVLGPKPFKKCSMKKIWAIQNFFIVSMVLGFIAYMIGG